MLSSALEKADCQQCGVVQQELSMNYQGQKGPRSLFITDMVIIGQVLGYTDQEEPQDTSVFCAMRII